MNKLAKGALVLGAAGASAWLLARVLRPAYDFRRKVVLLTGGSRGLGLVLARQLAREGARLALCARDGEELERAADDVAHFGHRPLTDVCDVTDPEDVRHLVERVNGALGPIDVLINNAGVIQVGPQAVMTRDDYEQALRVHFWGPYNTVEAVLPQMRRRHAGRIVNISSIGGKVAVPHLLPYCASKFALVGFSEGLRSEVAPDGVVVTTVCPGLMRTGSPRNAFFKGQHRKEHAWFRISDSLPLLTISAEHAARQVLDACRYGRAEVVLSLPAKLAVKFHGLFPGLTANLLALVDRLLPAPGGIGTELRAGKDSESSATPSALTTLTEEAARRNNEMAPSEG